MTYLINSDVLIFYFKKRDTFFGLVESLLNKHDVAISVMTLTEVRGGWDEEQARRWIPIIQNLFYHLGYYLSDSRARGLSDR